MHNTDNLNINLHMSIDGKNMVIIGALIAIDLSEGKSIQELAEYKNLLCTIANNLQTIIAQHK